MNSTNRQCWLRHQLALLFVALTIAACADRELVITDFSKAILLDPVVDSEKVVGLYMRTKLSSGSDIVMSVGCKGKIYQRITVTASITAEQRLDWYSNCAEVSFEKKPISGRTMRLSYQFQVL